ncbi:MAG TPA: TonB-dependent receptor [Saprospiraceae bacterium]|nr:TonB-dependent receptor [Saprospiraceae bacterium]HMQ81483.1 TonB-dependent receptor [Saprospiraceae bacterium]
MKKIYLSCLGLCFGFGLSSQIITIKDQESGKPLEQVTLFGKTTQHFTTTNVRGQADISDFANEPHIEIRSLGFQTEVLSYQGLDSLSFQLVLVPYSISTSEVIVAATRWRQNSSDIPAKVIRISSREISLQNPQTAADLLSVSGKVFIQKSQQGGGSPMIRGFATNRLLYTVDGVRMNTAIFRGGNIQNVISLDPFAIDAAEVLFGAGSVIYGSDAIGGVMSFQTLTPQFSLSDEPFTTGKAAIRYASANQEKAGHFDVGVGWKKWAMITSISHNDYGDLKMGSQGPTSYLRPFYVQRQDSTDVIVTNEDPRIQTPSGYTQINMMQKLRFQPDRYWDFQYGFHYSETSDYSRYDRHIRYRNGLPRYGEWYYGPQKWLMNNLTISHSKKHALYDQMTLRLAQQFFEESRISRDINRSNRERRIEEVNAYSANLDLAKALGSGKNKLYYGLETVWNDVQSTGIDEDIEKGTSEDGPARYPQATWASYAAYLSGNFQVSQKMNVQAGVRYNQFTIDAVFDTRFYPFPYSTANLNQGAFTGSLGFVLRPSDQWVVTANAATAFRAPNVDDLGKVFDSEPGSVVVPNPDLEAEYATSYDFGIAKTFGNALKVDLSAYYTNLQNALVRRNFQLNGLDSIVYDGDLSQVQAIQNAAKANVYGLQLGVELKLSREFRFSTDFNYQKGEEELDDSSTSPSRHAAPWFGVARFNYAYKGLLLEFYSVYSAEVPFEKMPEEEKGKPEIYASDADGNPYSPDWYTMNFKASYPLNDQLVIGAGLENLTDQRYRPYSSGIVAPGRNFILSLRAKF